MQRTNPFHRVHALMAAMAALMSGSYAVMPGKVAATRSHAFELVGGYSSRGKRKTRTHDAGGTRAHQRAAQKRRNVKRHRKACRG